MGGRCFPSGLSFLLPCLGNFISYLCLVHVAMNFALQRSNILLNITFCAIRLGLGYKQYRLYQRVRGRQYKREWIICYRCKKPYNFPYDSSLSICEQEVYMFVCNRPTFVWLVITFYYLRCSTIWHTKSIWADIMPSCMTFFHFRVLIIPHISEFFFIARWCIELPMYGFLLMFCSNIWLIQLLYKM